MFLFRKKLDIETHLTNSSTNFTHAYKNILKQIERDNIRRRQIGHGRRWSENGEQQTPEKKRGKKKAMNLEDNIKLVKMAAP